VTVRSARPPYVGTAAVLLGFVAVSYVIPWSRVHFPADFPPLFLNWYPLVGPELLVPVALGGALLLLLPRLLRAPLAVLLVGLVAFCWLFSVSLAVESGHIRTFNGCCLPGGAAAILSAPFERRSEYYAAIPLIDELGPRGFAERYPELDRSGVRVLPLHVTTHPPGAPLLLWALSRATGGSVLDVALLVVLVGAAGAVPTYAIAREAYGAPAARLAAALYAVSPGVLIYSATSMDVVFMTAIAVAMAFMIRAPRSAAWAVAGGAMTAVALCLTWAALVLGLLGLGVGILAVRRGIPFGTLARRGLLALAAFVATAIAVRLAIGLDLPASYARAVVRQTHYLTYRRSYPYWVFGNVVALLITSGLANAALVVAETRRRWRARDPGLETVLGATMVLTSLASVFKGETDHNWLFFVPLVVTVAAAATERVRGPATANLAQAMATEVFFYTGW
jgi:methylthioxylose transferase